MRQLVVLMVSITTINFFIAYNVYISNPIYRPEGKRTVAPTTSPRTISFPWLSNKHKIVGFYHLGPTHSWKEIMDEQMQYLYDEGLLEATKTLNIGIAADDPSNATAIKPEVFEVLQKYTNDLEKIETFWVIQELFEFDTLALLYAHCKENTQDFVYYFHSKGTSTDKTKMKYQLAIPWRRVMQHFLFTRWKEVYQFLKKGTDVVGVNYFCLPHPHFSGNFWWASCKYLNNHNPPRDGDDLARWNQSWPQRYYDEAWLLNVRPGETVKLVETYHDPSHRYSLEPQIPIESIPSLPWKPKRFTVPAFRGRECTAEYTVDTSKSIANISVGTV
eukprot:TRINITY_DN9353_c0_g1_i2.p1 TRINITY_DN9353_c0_g1~~TRINITY_DN9353_c0_g1_i2.p1  ORF type:complete len:331 (+),score=52.21 TRINITY_DN9353_c0_g1_i2:110-1102(+)